MSVVFGGSFVWLHIGPGSMGEALQSLPVTTTKAVRLLRVAAIAAALSGVGWLASTIVNVTGDPASVFDAGTLRVFFFETPFGAPSLFRLALLLALAVSAVVPLAPRVFITVDIVVGTGLLVSQAWLGHAADGGASPYGLMMIACYALHVVGAAGWVGSLPVLALAMAERRRRSEGSSDLLARYSAMAIVAVAAIVLSGVANTLFHSGYDLRALVSSRYGEILLTKLMLVTAMLSLAAVNRIIVMPRLSTPRLSASRDHSLRGVLQKSVALEMLLAIFVLGVAATLGITAPPL